MSHLSAEAPQPPDVVVRPTLAIHGHFYQPAREDPFTGRLARDPSAAPAHDWNDRVTQEAYAPNAELGNFGRIGWDLGPTVARWMREHRRELHDTIMDQADRHHPMAQGYHHAILPLASARDRRTEVRWAIRDMELRTGRRPTGLWLPETAVDQLTLRICAEEGIRWTILAPWQADDGADTRVAHRVELGDGRRMVVGFYDAGLSATVSFDAGATADADRFAAGPVVDRLGHGGTALICTDGELYGHHQPFRDLFLERLLTDAARHRGIAVTTPGAWLGPLDPASLPQAHIAERTSWSCHHGVARWSGECGCAADGRWKAPLRQAFDRLAGGIDAVTEARLTPLGLDTWACRDRFVDVASGFLEPGAWVAEELRRADRGADATAGRLLLDLMQAQASRLAMFASCGWYWEDARRPETAQVLRFAAHAARLVDEACGSRLEEQLVDELAAVRVGRGATGMDLYATALDSVGQARLRNGGQSRGGRPRPGRA
jgi:hypothetical protein